VHELLGPTRFLDCDSDVVQRFAAAAVRGAIEDRERAVRLFYAVRDRIRYDPYTVTTDPHRYRANSGAQAPSAFCVPKAVLLAACGRAVGIATRLGFADVRNHLSSQRLRARMGTDLFAFHGFAELWLEGCWVKATPAFNRELCERFGVLPLEFDGVHDALFQPFDARGRRHMEYVHDRGVFADLPFDDMVRVLLEMYPTLTEESPSADGDPDFS